MKRLLLLFCLANCFTLGALHAAQSDLTETGTDLGNGWVDTTALGALFEDPAGTGWHYSPSFGWIFPCGENGAYWFYNQRIDWSYASSSSAPNFFNQPLDSWVWRDVTVSGLDRVHDFSEGFTGTFAEVFSPTIGSTIPLITRFHDVAGDVTFIGMRRLRIDNFVFDGAGIDVRPYFADSSGTIAPILVGEDLRRDTPYAGETIEVAIPAPYTIEDFDYFSIWCVPVFVSFGDLDY